MEACVTVDPPVGDGKAARRRPRIHFRRRHTPSSASGGDLGLQDGCRRLVEIVGWLRWKRAYPVAIGPGQAEQTKRHGPRSFSRWGAHLDPWRLPRSPLGGPTVTGWAGGRSVRDRAG
jgi:hypothetical protein